MARRLLDEQELDREKLVDLLDKLNTQSVRASDVIQRLRSYIKKPNAGLVTADLNAIIRDVIALAEVDSRLNDVAVHFEPYSDLPLVAVDVVQIQQIALNLIRNAMEAMASADNRQQGVVVTTELLEGAIRVNVIDCGLGISKEEESKLFTPFYSTKNSGMGIGLSICQSIVQAHGGSIGFTANASGGSCFNFSLPLK